MSNLFNYDVNLQPAVMDIRSETLEPISSATNRYVFRLDQAGELDANSVLLFKAVSNDATLANKLRVNSYGGGLLAIKRATFQVGDYVLNDCNDIGRIASLVDLGSVDKASQSKYNSHYFQNNFHTKILDMNADTHANFETKFGGSGSIVYDRERSAFDFGEPNNANANARVNNCIITTSKATSHQIGIPLGNIFPCLKGQTIPLFLFQDYRILLTIEFHDCSLWVNDATTTGTMTCATGKVVPEDVKLQVDYIIYPSEVQNAMRQQTAQQGGLNLVFPDIIKIENKYQLEQQIQNKV